MSKLQTIEAVIEALGGVVAVSRLFGCSHNVVSNWKAAGRFPDRLSTYRTIAEALAEGGLEADEDLFRQNGGAA